MTWHALTPVPRFPPVAPQNDKQRDTEGKAAAIIFMDEVRKCPFIPAGSGVARYTPLAGTANFLIILEKSSSLHALQPTNCNQNRYNGLGNDCYGYNAEAGTKPKKF